MTQLNRYVENGLRVCLLFKSNLTMVFEVPRIRIPGLLPRLILALRRDTFINDKRLIPFLDNG
jgi:hypothetical protein